MRAELKLIPPQPGRTPFWHIRGSYLGSYVNRSARSADKAVAKQALAKIKRDIERGEFAKAGGPTFLTAATVYLDARPDLNANDARFIARLSLYFAATPLAKIDQAAIDRAGMEICPDVQPATRNREVHTPISAILRHSGITLAVRRPKGANGTPRQAWMKPEQVEAYLAAAWSHHVRFAALCTFLIYTGVRLSEALRLQVEDLDVDQAFALIGRTKNGEPQGAYLPPVVVQAIRLALLEPGNATWERPKMPRQSGSLFCLTKSGALYKLFREVETLSKVALPKGVAFHLARHTYGARMRRAGVRLEETGRWNSRAGSKPYDHYDVTQADRAADLFPGAQGLSPNIKIVSA